MENTLGLTLKTQAKNVNLLCRYHQYFKGNKIFQ